MVTALESQIASGNIQLIALARVIFSTMMFHWPMGVLAWQFSRLTAVQQQAWRLERLNTEQIRSLGMKVVRG